MFNSSKININNMTKKLMEKYGLNFKKSLGQNFLVNRNILNEIISLADISTNDDVIEIGPGIGILTEQLVSKSHDVLSLEIDDQLANILDDLFSSYENINIINQDVLNVDLEKMISNHFDGNHNVKIVSNLPYYIATRIILSILVNRIPVDSIIVMVQKEVAQRLTAHPNNKNYGSLSVISQYYADIKMKFSVSRNAFIPKPNVDSAIIILTPKKDKFLNSYDNKLFGILVKKIFAHKRKTLFNNLQNIYGNSTLKKEKLKKILREENLDIKTRPQQLDVYQFISLINKLIKLDCILGIANV